MIAFAKEELGSWQQRNPATRHSVAVSFIQSDVEHHRGGPYDVVTLLLVLQYVSQPHRLLRRVHDVLAPGGRCYIGVWGSANQVRVCKRLGSVL